MGPGCGDISYIVSQDQGCWQGDLTLSHWEWRWRAQWCEAPNPCRLLQILPLGMGGYTAKHVCLLRAQRVPLGTLPYTPSLHQALTEGLIPCTLKRSGPHFLLKEGNGLRCLSVAGPRLSAHSVNGGGLTPYPTGLGVLDPENGSGCHAWGRGAGWSCSILLVKVVCDRLDARTQT